MERMAPGVVATRDVELVCQWSCLAMVGAWVSGILPAPLNAAEVPGLMALWVPLGLEGQSQPRGVSMPSGSLAWLGHRSSPGPSNGGVGLGIFAGNSFSW